MNCWNQLHNNIATEFALVQASGLNSQSRG